VPEVQEGVRAIEGVVPDRRCAHRRGRREPDADYETYKEYL